MDQIAVLVPHQLHFDVPRARDEFFQEDVRAAEGGQRFALGLFQRRGQFLGRIDDAHAAAAAPFGRFEQHGKAEPLGQIHRGLAGRQRLAAAGEDRHLRNAGNFAGRDLVAQLLQNLRRRPAKDDAGLLARPGQIGIFRQEPVARMNRIDAVLLGDGDDAGDVEVSPDRFAGLADQIGFVGFESVQRVAIFVRIDGYGADAQFMGSAEDADRDFTTVRDQELGDRCHTLSCHAPAVERSTKMTESVKNVTALPPGGLVAGS